jgi:hypothetical protein
MSLKFNPGPIPINSINAIMGGGSSPVLVLIPIPFGSKKWDPISIPIQKPDWNQAQITKSRPRQSKLSKQQTKCAFHGIA